MDTLRSDLTNLTEEELHQVAPIKARIVHTTIQEEQQAQILQSRYATEQDWNGRRAVRTLAKLKPRRVDQRNLVLNQQKGSVAQFGAEENLDGPLLTPDWRSLKAQLRSEDQKSVTLSLAGVEILHKFRNLDQL